MADIAVLDASVILLIIAPVKDSDPEDRRLRRERTLESLREYRKDKVHFVVPAPTIVEIAAGPSKNIDAMNKLLARLGGSHVEPLEDLSARAAGASLRKTLHARSEDERRDGVKFDALIAGIAHAMGARYVLTANARDFQKHLRELKSKVEVVQVDAAKTTGQLRIIDQTPKS